MNKVFLKRGRERSAERRHPWVFSGAVDAERTGEGVLSGLGPGETVEVCSADGETLGVGWHSPASQIRIRLLAFGPEAADGAADGDDAALVRDRVGASVGRRAAFFADAATNAVRLVNAESDGLPGVVADYYAGFVVCQFTSAGAARRAAAVAEALMAFAPFCRGVSERLDVEVRAKEGLPTEPAFRILAGEEPPELIEISEGPCKFLVDVRRGHKTGFYLDQRDARAAVGPLANGGEVLNCFCYTGGFGLYARACGAAKVTQVDASEDALALARKNEALTHFCGTETEYVAADVFRYLRTCRDAGKTFDLIVLDPPKFAATKGQLMKAARGYKDINLLAMKLLKPGGTLATFSCSGAMTSELFDQVLAEAAVDAGRGFQVTARTHAGADHPVALSFPEGEYLKGVILRRLS